jgi:ABC-type glycerol-3-phosphate transport system permease component
MAKHTTQSPIMGYKLMAYILFEIAFQIGFYVFWARQLFLSIPKSL